MPVCLMLVEMKTDLNLLLECVKYQMDHPVSQKEALITIYSICQENSKTLIFFFAIWIKLLCTFNSWIIMVQTHTHFF